MMSLSTRLFVIMFASLQLLPATFGRKCWVYLGTSEGGSGAGIRVCEFDSKDGGLGTPRLVAGMDQPTYLTIHPTGRFLYAAGEREEGIVRAFAIDPKSGDLTVLNEASSGGVGPCFVELDTNGRNALVANYNGGASAVVRVQENGRLGAVSAVHEYEGSGPVAGRQEASHAHCARLDPSEHFLFVADLGADRIWRHAFDPATGKVGPADPDSLAVAPGSGPRHLRFDPTGKRLYVVYELSNEVAVFDWKADSAELVHRQTISTLPAGFEGANKAAELAFHPNGRFLYVSNRGEHNSIALFAIDPTDGHLALRGDYPSGGEMPRHFAFDPSGKWLLVANKGSDTVTVFAVDAETGALHPTDSRISIPQPTFIGFLKGSG